MHDVSILRDERSKSGYHADSGEREVSDPSTVTHVYAAMLKANWAVVAAGLSPRVRLSTLLDETGIFAVGLHFASAYGAYCSFDSQQLWHNNNDAGICPIVNNFYFIYLFQSSIARWCWEVIIVSMQRV